MLSLNTHQINVFLIASETLNFTQAAQMLEMTQPCVSQHIQALEEHFGVTLFTRAGRNIELTDAGMALVPLAREMVFLATHIEETMASLKGDVHGHLRVGCSTSTGRYILPKILATFHRRHPQVRATCHVAPQAQALEMLAEGKVHLVMASNPPVMQNVEFHAFTSEKIMLIAPLDHPWTKKPIITLEEMCQADFLLPEEGSETYAEIREALAALQHSIYELKTVVTLGSLEAITLSVYEGLGVGFVPELVINRLVQDKVALIKVQELEIHREVYVGKNTRRPATRAQEAFWDFLSTIDSSFFSSFTSQPAPTPCG